MFMYPNVDCCPVGARLAPKLLRTLGNFRPPPAQKFEHMQLAEIGLAGPKLTNKSAQTVGLVVTQYSAATSSAQESDPQLESV